MTLAPSSLLNSREQHSGENAAFAQKLGWRIDRSIEKVAEIQRRLAELAGAAASGGDALRLAPPHRGKADTRGDEGHRMMQQHAGQ